MRIEASRGELFSMAYDKLVIGVGAYSRTYGIPGVKENAFFLKDVQDARKIRNKLLSCFETAALPTTPVALKKQLLNFAIVSIMKGDRHLHVSVTSADPVPCVLGRR